MNNNYDLIIPNKVTAEEINEAGKLVQDSKNQFRIICSNPDSERKELIQGTREIIKAYNKLITLLLAKNEQIQDTSSMLCKLLQDDSKKTC